MKTLLLSTDDVQNFRQFIYDPKVANLDNSKRKDASLMALQYYLKHPGNYTNSTPTSATIKASEVQIQRTSTQLQQPVFPALSTTNHGIITRQQQDGVVVSISNNGNGINGHTHSHHNLLAQSQTQLKQLQLKQPTIHQHHQHAASFHHPYYQQHTSSTPANTTTHVTHGHSSQSTGHSHTYSQSVSVHALNQNSNFSAASSSTGGGTASSHAPTQQSNTTGSSLSPPGNTTSARTTPASGSSSLSSSVSNNGMINGRISAVNGAKKIKTEPVLSQFHQTERLTFANAHVSWTEDHWKRVVFQDERKFNLDGPDGFSYYFHDLRNYERTLSQRPRGNSVYIYLVIAASGPIHLEVTTSKLKTETSVEIIIRERINIITKLGSNTEFFLQDHNWITNTLPSVQEWLNIESIKTQKWPTVSHDINIMEGIWGWLIREVFDGGRKFSRKDDLIFRIREAWSRLPLELLSNLYSTLPERITQLNYTRGGYTNC